MTALRKRLLGKNPRYCAHSDKGSNGYALVTFFKTTSDGLHLTRTKSNLLISSFIINTSDGTVPFMKLTLTAYLLVFVIATVVMGLPG